FHTGARAVGGALIKYIGPRQAYSSRAAFLQRAHFTFDLDQAPMQIFETLSALRGGGVQFLQAEQAVNVSEDSLTLIFKRIADPGPNIIDPQTGAAPPDPV